MRKKTRIKNKENLSIVPPIHTQIEEHAKSITATDSFSRVLQQVDNFEKKTCQSSAASESTRKSRDSTVSATLLQNSKLSTSSETNWGKSRRQATSISQLGRRKKSVVGKQLEASNTIQELPVP